MMRYFTFLAATIIGLWIGISLQPIAVDALNMEDDLAFCRADLAALTDQAPTLARRTKERDIAVREAEEWHGYYEDARQQVLALTAKLNEERSINAQIRMAYEATKQDLSSARYMLAKPAAVEEPPKKKKKTIKKKRTTKPTKVVKRKVYRPWLW